MATSNNTTVAAQPIIATIKGFTYRGDWAFLVVLYNNTNTSILIGSKADNKISDLIALKGCSAEFIHKGQKVVNGTTYEQYSLQCIAF